MAETAMGGDELSLDPYNITFVKAFTRSGDRKNAIIFQLSLSYHSITYDKRWSDKERSDEAIFCFHYKRFKGAIS